MTMGEELRMTPPLLSLRGTTVPKQSRRGQLDGHASLAMTRNEGFFELVVRQPSFFELLSLYLPRGSFGYAVYEFNSLGKLKISQVVTTKAG